MSPISSVVPSDFVAEVITLELSVAGLGGINYSVRIELPAFPDNIRAVAGIIHQVHAASFAVEVAPDGI
jgi:hypothetical protein